MAIQDNLSELLTIKKNIRGFCGCYTW